MERTSKRLALAEAIEKYVPDGVESLAVGGMHMHNNPMALVREIWRQKKHIKRLITSPAGCINADLLIGAGLVEEVVTPYIGFEHLGLAPAFRRFAQEGRIKVHEIDAGTLIAGLRAGASGAPFAALPPGLELTDLPKFSPEFYKTASDPFSGRSVLVAPAIRPKVALVVAQQADQYGNAVFKGSVFADREIMQAAETVVLQVEQVISTQQLTKNPVPVNIGGQMVRAVVDVSFGCHPTACHRFYHYETGHLEEYIRLAATAEGFNQYVEKYLAEGGENDYVNKTQVVGGF